MNLDDYIAETLRQIASGVTKAQDAVAQAGGEVNPPMRSNSTVNSAIGMIPTEQTGVYAQLVRFDVALTVKEGTGTKGGIGVATGVINLGSAGQSSNENTSVNHVQFAVPVVLPRSWSEA